MTELSQGPARDLDDLADVRFPEGVRLISKQLAIKWLLDEVAPMPEATLDDGSLRKSFLAQFLPDGALSEALTPEDELRLELIWLRAGLPLPERVTETEWRSKYLQALKDAPDCRGPTRIPQFQRKTRLRARRHPCKFIQFKVVQWPPADRASEGLPRRQRHACTKSCATLAAESSALGSARGV